MRITASVLTISYTSHHEGLSLTGNVEYAQLLHGARQAPNAMLGFALGFVHYPVYTYAIRERNRRE